MQKKLISYSAILCLTTALVVSFSQAFFPNNILEQVLVREVQAQGTLGQKINLKKIPKKYQKAFEMISQLTEEPDPSGETANDKFCKSKLLGTMSLESCQASCPANACTIVQTHKKEFNPELTEDLSCYGCAAGMSCYDMGLIYNVPDCIWCEANPKKQCVSGIPVPGMGFGPGAIPLPTDPAGRQCYDCIDRKDECKNVWPGSTWDPACGAACKVNEVCVQIGVHPDGYGCFKCQKNPPPPIDCNDVFLLHQNQCNACPPKSDCVPALGPTGQPLVDEKGSICFECVPKNAPPPPPPPPKTCEGYGWKTPECSCDPNNEIKVTQIFPNDLSCCKCEPNPCQPSPPRFTHQQCLDQCKFPDTCQPQTTVRGDVPCYTCSKYRSPAETCEQAGIPSSCDPFPCEPGELCTMQDVALLSGKQVKCAQCSPNDDVNPDNCMQYGGFWSCAVCYQAGLSCKMEKVTATPELWCAKCFEQCDEQGASPGDCSLAGTCPEDQDCITTDDGCHICQPKPKCEEGILLGACPGTCSEIQNCTQVDDYCYKCEDKPQVTPQCPQGTSMGLCPGSCSSGQDCENVGAGCYQCKPKVSLGCQSDAECDDGAFCNGTETCNSQNGQCLPGDPPCHGQECVEDTDSCGDCSTDAECDDGEYCNGTESCNEKHECSSGENPCTPDTICEEQTDSCSKPATTPVAQCPQGTSTGVCDGHSCSEGEECVTVGDDCHRCQKKKQSCEDMGMTDGDTCVQTCVEKGGKCVQKSEDDFGTKCWECQTKDGCSYGYEPKPCFGAGVICGFDYVCEQDDNWCHKCVPISRTPPPPPPSQCDQGFQVGTCPGGCSQNENCVQAGGCYSCTPKPVTETACPDEYKPGNCNDQFECFKPACYEVAGPCYKCRPGDCHEPYFRERDCKYCEEKGGQCMPAGAHIASGLANLASSYHSLDDCYECKMPKKRITITRTYIIIIVETPFGRYILKEAKDASDFTPGSVAALAAAEDLGNNTFKIGSSIFSGGSFGSIEDLAKTLSQGAEKKKSYGEDCFSEVKSSQIEKTPPPDVDPKAKESKPTTLGEDKSDQVMVDGPLVSCGKVDGKDALVVFDYAGRPVQTILKDELKKNPNVLIDALAKADELSQQAQSISQQIVQLQNANMKTAAQNLGKMLLKKVLENKDEENIVPNDPFFHLTEKKKKKLFGILGSSKPAKPNLQVGNIFATAAQEKGEVDIKDQWGLKKIGFLPMGDPNSAWNVIDGSEKNVLVAVIDSGFDATHEDAPEFLWVNEKEIPGNGQDDDNNGFVDDVNGWNFLNDNADLTDYCGHGTFVSGIIAAKRNNGLGIAGINPGAIIMPLKVANENGEASSLNIYRAIHYAVDHGARVINVSLGSRGISKLEQAVINYAHEHGVFVSVASGNTGEYMGDVGPASATHAFAVGAVDLDGLRSTISSEGPNNALMAPGESIYSLRSKDSFDKRAIHDPIFKLYFTQDGTSFSTPMVSATAALMLAKNPKLTPDDIEDILAGTAIDMDEPGWDGKTGAGLLNATEALKRADEKFLNVKITHFEINKNEKKKLESVDVYATVRGAGFKEFSVGLGKGKLVSKFKTIVGPFTEEVNEGWVARIDQDALRGSDEWVIQIKAVDKQGNVKVAQTLLDLSK